MKIAGILQGPNNFDSIQGREAYNKMINRINMSHVMVNVFVRTSNNVASADFSKINDISYMINQIHNSGKKVLLRVMHTPWNYNPTDSTLWWQSFSEASLRWANYAQQNNVESIMISNEMKNIENNTSMWQSLITATRNIYSGQLIYETNWWQPYTPTDNTQQKLDTTWFNKLDALAISAYWPMSDGRLNPSVSYMRSMWDDYQGESVIDMMEELGGYHNVPLICTVGLASVQGASKTPYTYTFNSNDVYSELEQSNYYQAVHEKLGEGTKSRWVGYAVDGVYKTSPTLSASSLEFMVTDKIAESILSDWFKESNGGGCMAKIRNNKTTPLVFKRVTVTEQVISIPTGVVQEVSIDPNQELVFEE